MERLQLSVRMAGMHFGTRMLGLNYEALIMLKCPLPPAQSIEAVICLRTLVDTIGLKAMNLLTLANHRKFVYDKFWRK